MRRERIRIGDLLAGGWGLGLFAVLWLDWYATPTGGRNAWESFAVVDVLVAVTALVCVAIPVVVAASKAPVLPVAVTVVALALTTVTMVVVLLRLVFEPGPDQVSAVDAGGYLGFFCVWGALLGTYLALRDERMPGVPEPGPFPVMPVPPA